MGTPGDKRNIRKVVERELTSPELPQQPNISSTAQPSIPAEEMGVISRLPTFDTFASININPSIPVAIAHPSSATPLEYYSDNKFYQNISDDLQPLYPIDVIKQEENTFLSIDQPGPSGLQTPPKSTPIASLTKLNVKKKNSSKKPFACTMCQKTFTTLDKLTRHQQTHSSTSPFRCENCKKSFTSRFKLVRHTLIHSDRKPFSCTLCERTFHRKDHLKNHIKVHSPTKSVYACEKEDCKKEYTSQMSYRKHLALHAAQEGSLECQICSSVFSTKEEILYHLKIHAGSRTIKNPSEKKFTCEHCDRKFFTKKDVKRHLVVHTGMRDFLCQFCPQRFGRKDHLGRHIKKSHLKNMPPEDSSEVTVKTEVKAEISEPDLSGSSLSTEMLDFESILEQKFSAGFTSEMFLPSTSAQSDLTQILGSIDEAGGPLIGGAETVRGQSELLSETDVLNSPEIRRLLQPSDEVNLPLPGFSQTFQPPPPP